MMAEKPLLLEDPLITYYNKNKRRFVSSFQDDKDYNDNIDSIFYDKNKFQQFMKEECNFIEREWRTRILFENTPRGNIVMFYDPYKQGFSYYCDFNSIPYPVLNAIAMKYVILFRCRDFFVDNKITLNYNYLSTSNDNAPIFSSPLIPIFYNEEKKDEKKSVKKAHRNDRNSPFARLKTYVSKTEPIIIDKKPYPFFLNKYLLQCLNKSLFFMNQFKTFLLTNVKKQLSAFSIRIDFLTIDENLDNKKLNDLKICKKETEHNYNRFIHLGKVNNFRIMPLTNRTNNFNGFQSNLLTNIVSESALQKQITNYKDYKNLIQR
jgi:hypothetical protein